MSHAPWILGGIAAVLGLLAAAATDPGRTTVQRVEGIMGDWARKVIERVSTHEGRPDSVNRNRDGQGVSFGILQWTQRSGNLGVLLAKMAAIDRVAFITVFGPSWTAVLDVTHRASLEPVDGAALWEDPWVARFVAAGRVPAFVGVQYILAVEGEHFRGAEAVATLLGIRTERAMALFFDRSVQQGPAGARRIAEQVLAELEKREGQTSSVPDRLAIYARLAADRFRRTTEPSSPEYSSLSPHLKWKRVGAEWHTFAGSWDLYDDIRRRTIGILADPSLSDDPVPDGRA